MTYLSLTFDDGFLMHYEAARELYSHDILSTFFIITGVQRYNARSLLLRKPRLIRDIADMGHEIGSHAHTHKDLTMISAKEVEEECISSARTLGEVLRDDSSSYGIAYPYSSYNDQVINVVSKYFRYGRAMGGIDRWNKTLDPYRIGSMGIRHLIKYPIKAFENDVKLIVLTFHDEPLTMIRLVVGVLKTMNFRIVPLLDALGRLGVTQ